LHITNTKEIYGLIFNVLSAKYEPYIYQRIYRRSRVGSTVIELVQKLLYHESHRCASTMISADLYRL